MYDVNNGFNNSCTWCNGIISEFAYVTRDVSNGCTWHGSPMAPAGDVHAECAASHNRTMSPVALTRDVHNVWTASSCLNMILVASTRAVHDAVSWWGFDYATNDFYNGYTQLPFVTWSSDLKYGLQARSPEWRITMLKSPPASNPDVPTKAFCLSPRSWMELFTKENLVWQRKWILLHFPRHSFSQFWPNQGSLLRIFSVTQVCKGHQQTWGLGLEDREQLLRRFQKILMAMLIWTRRSFSSFTLQASQNLLDVYTFHKL